MPVNIRNVQGEMRLSLADLRVFLQLLLVSCSFSRSPLFVRVRREGGLIIRGGLVHQKDRLPEASLTPALPGALPHKDLFLNFSLPRLLFSCLSLSCFDVDIPDVFQSTRRMFSYSCCWCLLVFLGLLFWSGSVERGFNNPRGV